jgi:hypothetical protein
MEGHQRSRLLQAQTRSQPTRSISLFRSVLLASRRSKEHPRPDVRDCSPFSRVHAWARVGRTLLACTCVSQPRGPRATDRRPRGPLAPHIAFHVYLKCNTRSTFETFGCNTCNIQKRQRKPMRLKH